MLGNALGFAMVQGVSQIPAVGGLLENVYSPGIFAQSMLIALLLGAVVGLYPAWRAASLHPIEAMRYDGSSGKSQAQAPRIGGMALRNILRQRTRMLLTTLGIGLGVGLVVMLGGMADGFVKQLSDMGTKSGELTIGEAKASDMSLAKVDERIGRWAAALPAVEAVSGLLLGVGSVPGTSYFIVLGLDPNAYAIRHFAITQGGALQTARDILLGKVAAKNLKKQVGDSIRISGSVYRVVGIYETGTGYEDGGGVIALKEAQRLLARPGQVSWFYVKLRDTDQAEPVRRQIETRFPEASVSRASDFAEKTNDMKVFRNMTNALSLISVLVGGIGIMNAMLMSVYERTREIGTLRALGWRRRRVVGMILSESLILSFLSGLAGIAVGVGLGELLTLEPTMGAFLKGSYTLQLFGQAMLIAIVLGVIGALYPAWRAANLSPIEALRYE
jgi:ABC-type antimicrobial peptide transport system permease subunit